MNIPPVLVSLRATWVALLFLPLATHAADPAKTPPAEAKPVKMLKPLRADDNKIPTLELKDVTTKPVPQHRVDPQYPFEMRRINRQADVVVDFVVDENGKPRNVHAVNDVDPTFARSAEAAISQWRYSPGKKGDEVVRTHLQQTLVFKLTAK